MLEPEEDFRNNQEEGVRRWVEDLAPRYPAIATSRDLRLDACCIALNRLPARYVRDTIALTFYRDEAEQVETERAIEAAVTYALEFLANRPARPRV